MCGALHSLAQALIDVNVTLWSLIPAIKQHHVRYGVHCLHCCPLRVHYMHIQGHIKSTQRSDNS